MKTKNDQQLAQQKIGKFQNKLNYEVDLNSFKANQDFVAYQNSYSDRNFSKQFQTISFNHVNNSPQQSPKLSLLASPVNQKSVHKKSMSHTNLARNQNLLPNIRNLSNSTKNADGNSQPRYFNNRKEVISFRDKVSRSTFISRYSQYDSNKYQSLIEYNLIESQKGSQNTFYKIQNEIPGRHDAIFQNDQITHNIQQSDQNQFLTEQVQQHKGSKKMSFSMSQVQHEQKKPHSLDSSQTQNKINENQSQDLHKYKKMDEMRDQLDFNLYCKLKIQEVKQTNAQQDNNFSSKKQNKFNNTINTCLNSTNQSDQNINQKLLSNNKQNAQESNQNILLEIPYLQKKMVETIYLQKQAKQIFEKNSQNRISQMLDLPYYKWKRDGKDNTEQYQQQSKSIINTDGSKNQKNVNNHLINKPHNSLEQSQITINISTTNQIHTENNQILSSQLQDNNNIYQIKTDQQQQQLTFPQFKVKMQGPQLQQQQQQQQQKQIQRRDKNQTSQVSKIHRVQDGYIKIDQSSLNDINKSISNQSDYFNGLNILQLNQQHQSQNNIDQNNSINNYNDNNTTTKSNNSKSEQGQIKPIRRASEHVFNIDNFQIQQQMLSPISLQNSPSYDSKLINFSSSPQVKTSFSLNKCDNNNKNTQITPQKKLFQNDSNSKNIQSELNVLEEGVLEKSSYFQNSQLNQTNNNNSSRNKQSFQVQNNFEQNNQRWKVKPQPHELYKKSIQQIQDLKRKSSMVHDFKNSEDYEQNSDIDTEKKNEVSSSNSLDISIQKNQLQSSEKKKKSIQRRNSQNIIGRSISQVIIPSNEKNQDDKIIYRDQKNPLQNQGEAFVNKEFINDPLFKDFSDTEQARKLKKQQTFNYSLKKQSFLLQLGSQQMSKQQIQQSYIEQQQTNVFNQVGNSTTSNKKQGHRKVSSMNFIPLDNKLSSSITQIGSNPNIIIPDITSKSTSYNSINYNTQNPNRKSSLIKILPAVEDTQIRAIQSERKIQIQQQRDQQLEQIYQARRNREKRFSLKQLPDYQHGDQNYKIEVVQMSQIQENDDEMNSPQPKYLNERKRNQTIFVPQLKSIDNIGDQLSQNIEQRSSPTKKKNISDKLLDKHLNCIKQDLTNLLSHTLKMSDIKEEINQYVNNCIVLLQHATAQIISSVNKNKYFMFSEEQLKLVGEFFRDKLFEYGFDLQEVLFFHKKYNFLISQIFRKSLLDQIENSNPLNQLIDETISKLSDKIIFLKKFELEDLDNLRNAIMAMLSDSKDILLYYLDIYKDLIKIQPLDFSMLKMTLYDILKQKHYSDDVVFSVIEKVEKVRNYLFPQYQFSDSNFRKNITSLFYYDKTIGGYFLDPSLQTIQEFIHSLWNCLHGLNTFEKFAEQLKNFLKIEPNVKFIEILYDFIIEYIQKTLNEDQMDDLIFKFFKLKQIINSQQLIPTIAQIDINQLIETIKEITLIKSISKQIPVDLKEAKIFDYRFLQTFIEFVIGTNKEVISVYEIKLIKVAMNTDLDTVNFQFEILKQALNTLNLELRFVDDITFLYNLLLIKQLSK
ncbi:hypothetical protein TTHERM_00854260 (macronuclear) [Tetrahymena thermophila SB210]|uniref:Uncharacterized protein n=1 Tax=Tetrahymena thermophila (strain SB210) TaxID=312017 RepID=Q23CN3_TETTS|nr:hypothetical protein TTHERM_00854260 [Tetrahymena thermophila SB210]EAR94247.2 hypothetical protein TTHERM_00854260 [Tetrahymena thermophila SB210]|eukprot:XP_001014492.2 hypothetical protein TTHERM_00854260 [Tetrahymena thermophila SB210]